MWRSHKNLPNQLYIMFPSIWASQSVFHPWYTPNRHQNKIFCPITFTFEPPHDKTNKMACAPSEDSDQPGHLPSLIWVLNAHMKKAWVLSYPLSTQRRLWSDWADAILLVLSWGGSFIYYDYTRQLLREKSLILKIEFCRQNWNHVNSTIYSILYL